MSSNTNFLASSSPPKVEETEKQGISSILGSDSQTPKPSFRRTLSADMSSKTWLAQNGFKSPTIKKIASSAQLSIIDSSTSSYDEDVEEEFDTKKTQQSLKQGVWSSIMYQTKKPDEELPPPYVHPLVKKSNSALSGKSLEICTESLGSETGSDGFSSNPSSEAGSEVDEEETQQREKVSKEMELPVIAKYNNPAAAGKKLQARSFPPPLQSLVQSSKGPSLQMQSRRVNGRLVLEVVSVPSTKNFHAQRQDGRLRLTLIKTPKDQEKVEQAKLNEVVQDDMEELSEILQEEANELVIYDNDEEDEEMDEEVEKEIKEHRDTGIMIERTGPIMNVHRSALMIKKLKQNPKRSHKLNYTTTKLMEFDAQEDEETIQLPQSLPPRPRTTRLIPGPPATSFNAYEYFWRAKPVAASLKSKLEHTHCPPLQNNTTNRVVAFNMPEAYKQQEELSVPRDCKEARKILLSWEPYCIATS